MKSGRIAIACFCCSEMDVLLPMAFIHSSCKTCSRSFEFVCESV